MAYTITSVSTSGDSVTYLRDLYTALNVNNDWYDSVVKDETNRTLTFSKDSKTLVVITVPSTLTATSGYTVATYGVSNNVSSGCRVANNTPTVVIVSEYGIVIDIMYSSIGTNTGAVIFTTGAKGKLVYGYTVYASTGTCCLMSEDDGVAVNSTSHSYENKQANVTQLVPYVTVSDGTTKEWTKDVFAVIRKENTSTSWSTMTLDNVQYITNNIIAMKA